MGLERGWSALPTGSTVLQTELPLPSEVQQFTEGCAKNSGSGSHPDAVGQAVLASALLGQVDLPPQPPSLPGATWSLSTLPILAFFRWGINSPRMWRGVFITISYSGSLLAMHLFLEGRGMGGRAVAMPQASCAISKRRQPPRVRRALPSCRSCLSVG